MANSPKNGSRSFLYISVIIVNLVAFSGGMLIGWSSPVIAKLTDESRIDENPFGVVITTQEQSWITSLVGLGAMFGPILAGFVSDKLGRKKTLIYFSGAPLLLSYLMIAFGKTIIFYYIARFIAGLAVGAVLSILPHFLAEISEDSNRGTISSSIDVFLMSGTLYSFIVGPYLSIMWFNLSCGFWAAVFLVLFVFLVPETPYYLVATDDPSKAIKSLKKFRSTNEENATKEMETIKYSVDKDRENIGSFRDIFKSKASRKAFIITLSLLCFQQLSGIIVVLFNAQIIFSKTGSTIPPEISTMIIGGVQFTTSFITPFAVDRLGRRMLLLISAVGMCIAETPLGLYFYLSDNGKDVSSINWLPMACLVLYITSYNFGFGFVPWTVMAEVFPTNIKAPASTIISCSSSFGGFFLIYFFASLNSAIGMGGTFWLFSGFCALAALFVIFYMIETKGKSFQEIQVILSK